MKSVIFNARDKSILIANALDHFDTSLYGFLAPLLAPLFFPHSDPMVQIILAYSVMATSLITRPIGALIFGTLAWRWGPLHSLSYSLIGVALGTFLIGCLPTYTEIGWLAPALLILLRTFKGIFASGESTLSKLYIMENKPLQHALKASYFYQSSSLLGIILASAVATIVISSSWISWRLSFWLGGSVGFMSFILRQYATIDSCPEHKVLFEFYRDSKLKTIWKHKLNILRAAVITGFGHITYAVPFVLMNTLIPFVTAISLSEMMTLNTTLLIVDLLIFPLMGKISLRYNPTKLMTGSALILSLTLLPLFQHLPGASMTYVTFVRFWFIIWGVLFACPLNFWLGSLFKMPEKYLCVGFGNSLGAGFIGRTLTPFCLGLWYLQEDILLPAYYLTALTVLTTVVLYSTKLKQEA